MFESGDTEEMLIFSLALVFNFVIFTSTLFVAEKRNTELARILHVFLVMNEITDKLSDQNV